MLPSIAAQIVQAMKESTSQQFYSRVVEAMGSEPVKMAAKEHWMCQCRITHNYFIRSAGKHFSYTGDDAAFLQEIYIVDAGWYWFAQTQKGIKDDEGQSHDSRIKQTAHNRISSASKMQVLHLANPTAKQLHGFLRTGESFGVERSRCLWRRSAHRASEAAARKAQSTWRILGKSASYSDTRPASGNMRKK